MCPEVRFVQLPRPRNIRRAPKSVVDNIRYSRHFEVECGRFTRNWRWEGQIFLVSF